MLQALYFDGQSARAQAVILSARPGHIRLTGEAIDREWPLPELELCERLGSAPRRLAFASGGHCEVADHAGFSELMLAAGLRSRWVEKAQRNRSLIVLSVLLLLVFAALFYRFGLAWVTRITAAQVTPELAELLGDRTLELLDGHYLTPSQLPAERQARLRAAMLQLAPSPSEAAASPLLFRHSKTLGANALTLPDGRIVLLDALVALADDDTQVLAVLAHEQGHAAGRHGLQLLVRSTLVGAFTAWWVGDVSNLLVIGPTLLLNSRYSRELEQQADAYAVSLLQERNVSPLKLAEMLRKLEAAHRDDQASAPSWLRYLSSHPDTETRVTEIEKSLPAKH